MSGEVDLWGVFVPTLLVYAALAGVAVAILRRLLASVGAYRLVWHRPLFDIALFVILLAGIAAAVPRWMP